MGRVFKEFIFWAHAPNKPNSAKIKPQIARMQLDTGADRTVLARVPPGGVISGKGCINGETVDLVEIIANIRGTACTNKIEAAIRPANGKLAVVIGADYFQATKAILDYNGEVVGCPAKRPKRGAGFAGPERTGIMRFTRGACKRGAPAEDSSRTATKHEMAKPTRRAKKR